jgi:hypothetical protein
VASSIAKDSLKYEVAAKNDLGDSIVGTPAIADGSLFIRARTKLLAVGTNRYPEYHPQYRLTSAATLDYDRSAADACIKESHVKHCSPNFHHFDNWSFPVMSITFAKFVAGVFLTTGALSLGNIGTIDQAVAEGSGSRVSAVPELTFVALLDDEREDGEQPEAREREGERRESAEGREREQPRRESAERKEAEGERREGDRPREGEPRRDVFRPKTDNEEVLYGMIVQLRREVAELRNALRARGGEVRREGGERDQPRREGEEPRREVERPRGESDRPRAESDRPRAESDRPRERDGDRPAPAREGDRRESEKP